MTNREKEIWLEGHWCGLAAGAITEMCGGTPISNELFLELMKKAIRSPRTLDERTANSMYDLWKSEAYERLVEEYEDEQRLEATPAEDSQD